jgi:hypothetical protein
VCRRAQHYSQLVTETLAGSLVGVQRKDPDIARDRGPEVPLGADRRVEHDMNCGAGCLSASDSIVLRSAVNDNDFVSPRSGFGYRVRDPLVFV